jgi:hypothetical protein
MNFFCLEIAREKPSMVSQQLPEQFLVFLAKDLPIDPVFSLLKLHQPLSGTSWKQLLSVASPIGASDVSVSVLIEMMTGFADAFAIMKGSIVQMHALIVLLRSLSGCHVDAVLAHTTLQRLHNAFLHNSIVRKQIMASSVVSTELCRVIASAILHGQRDEDFDRLVNGSCLFLREIVGCLIAEKPMDSSSLLNTVRDIVR